jgi:predicted DNA-binding transcriptional regulator YafY
LIACAHAATVASGSREGVVPRYQQVLRQWKLLRRLEASTGGVGVAELAADEGLAERSVYRDLEALQAAGFPSTQTRSTGRSAGG